MTIETVQLKVERFTVDGYDLDGFAVELDAASRTLDFRLQLGKGLAIFWALPAAPNDRLRLVFVDHAASFVDEPELRADPWLADVPQLAWGDDGKALATFRDGTELTRVVFEASRGSYRFEADLRPSSASSRTIVLTWSG